MPGLLEFLGSDEAKLGLGLLAAGGPSATPLNAWQRVQGAVQGLSAEKQNEARLSLLQSQVDENKSQALLRQQQLALAQRKMALDEQFMGGGLLGPAPSGGVGGASSGAVPAMPSGGAGPAPSGGFNAQAISQQFGIPIEAVIADYRFNDGKKIAELIAKKAEPNWMNVGGNLVNTNAQGFKGGIQDQVNISNDGRATVLRANGGNPVVGAPAGALDTYAAYQGISNRSSADYTPERVIDPSTGQTVVRPRSQVLQGSPGPAGYATEAQMKVTASGDMGADPKAIQREIRATQNDLMKPGLDEGSKQLLREHLAGLQRAGANIGVKPMAENVVELSPAEVAANEAAAAAARTTAVKTAEGKVENAVAAPQKAQLAADAITLIDKALAHPGLSTSVGLSGKVDPRNYIPGTAAQDFQQIKGQLSGTAFLSAYQALRGSGSISEAEGKEAKASVARLSTAQSEPAFREALQDYRTILERGYRNAEAQSRGESPPLATSQPATASPAAKPPTPMKGMTMDGYKFKGGNPADPNNWTKL